LSTTDEQGQSKDKAVDSFPERCDGIGNPESLTGNTISYDEFRPSLVVIVEIGSPVPGGAIWRTHSAGTFYYYGCSCNTRSQRMM
jgi:hypothetical protein